MGRLKLLMAIHLHQPVGNFPEVFHKAVTRCYRPFVEEFASQEGLRFSLHISGPLLEYILDNHPGLMDTLAALVKEERLEMMGGGFYEPLLATIPTKDVLGQARLMDEFLREHFRASARGFWLTERVWAPSLPARLEGTGYRYTVVDDTHFLYAGFGQEELLDYYMTESLGQPLAIFPGLKKLRYLIPFRPMDEIIEFFRSLRPDEGFVGVTYGDDGEKFGLWPGTFEWVHKKGWLRRFLATLRENEDWLVTSTFTEFLDSQPPRGRAYFPTSSYEEMLSWALPARAAARYDELAEKFDNDESLKPYRTFIRGGLWENFLVKYPESNLMHKRMLLASDKVGHGPEGLTALYRSQCNCAYWHGLFGGLYLNHLRAAIWANIIDAEQAAGRGRDGPFAEVLDVDLDGRDEIFMGNDELWITVAPHLRGSAMELSLVAARFNAANVLARREEGYHRKLREAAAEEPDEGDDEGFRSIHDMVKAKESHLERLLIYDREPRYLFMDRLFADIPPAQGLLESDYSELTPYFSYNIVERGVAARGREARAELSFDAQGIKVSKRYLVARGGLEVSYRISCEGDEPFVFGVEHNLNLLASRDPEKYYRLPGEKEGRSLSLLAEYDRTAGFSLVNRRDGFTIRLDSSLAARLVHFPIETVSSSEEGFERNYQGSCFVLLYRIEPGRGPITLTQRLTVEMHG